MKNCHKQINIGKNNQKNFNLLCILSNSCSLNIPLNYYIGIKRLKDSGISFLISTQMSITIKHKEIFSYLSQSGKSVWHCIIMSLSEKNKKLKKRKKNFKKLSEKNNYKISFSGIPNFSNSKLLNINNIPHHMILKKIKQLEEN